MASVTDAELAERVKSTTKTLIAAAERVKSIQDSVLASQARTEDAVARIESALGLEPPSQQRPKLNLVSTPDTSTSAISTDASR